MNINVGGLAKDALMVGMKSIPFVGKAAELYDALELRAWKEGTEQKLDSIDDETIAIRHKLQGILETLRMTDIDGTSLSVASEHLFNLEQQEAIKTAFFEQLLLGSSHLEELKKNPQNYGKVLDPEERPTQGKMHLVIENENTMFAQMPFTFFKMLFEELGPSELLQFHKIWLQFSEVTNKNFEMERKEKEESPLDENTLIEHIKFLYSDYMPTVLSTYRFYEQALKGHKLWENFKRHPDQYGGKFVPNFSDISGPCGAIFENRQRQIVEVAPIVLSTILTSQKEIQGSTVRILNASGDLWAFPEKQ